MYATAPLSPSHSSVLNTWVTHALHQRKLSWKRRKDERWRSRMLEVAKVKGGQAHVMEPLHELREAFRCDVLRRVEAEQ